MHRYVDAGKCRRKLDRTGRRLQAISQFVSLFRFQSHVVDIRRISAHFCR